MQSGLTGGRESNLLPDGHGTRLLEVRAAHNAGPEQRKLTEGLLACARQQGLATLDSYDYLAASGKPRALYKLWHMNRDGNFLIAALVARTLDGNGK